MTHLPSTCLISCRQQHHYVNKLEIKDDDKKDKMAVNQIKSNQIKSFLF